MMPGMEAVDSYRGFAICRTAAGHLVVLDPRDTEDDRIRLVSLLAEGDALDALFFPTLAAARTAVDDWIALGLTHR